MMRLSAIALVVLLVLACSESPKASAEGPATVTTTVKPQRTAGASKTDAGSFTARSALPPRAGSRPEPQAAVDWTKPEEAMREWLAAVWFQDSKRLLRCFSSKGTFRLVDTSARRHATHKVAELAAELRSKGDWYTFIFGDDEPDFRDVIEDTHHLKWTEDEPLKFSAWQLSSYVWVRWRKEGDRYVVAEMAIN